MVPMVCPSLLMMSVRSGSISPDIEKLWLMDGMENGLLPNVRTSLVRVFDDKKGQYGSRRMKISCGVV